MDIHLRKKYPQDGHLGVQEGFWGSRLLTCKLRFPGLGGNCWPVTTVLSFCFCFLPVLELGRGPEWVQEPLSWPCPASLWPVPWAVPGTPLDPSAAPGCAPLLRKDHDNIQWTAQFSNRLGRVNFWNGPWSKCGAGDVCFPSGQPVGPSVEGPSADLGAVRCWGWGGQRLDQALVGGGVEVSHPTWVGGGTGGGAAVAVGLCLGVGSCGAVRKGQVWPELPQGPLPKGWCSVRFSFCLL